VDEEHRSRHGFRVGVRHQRAKEAVTEREAELVAGYHELDFTGLLTVTAPDATALAEACADYEHAAARVGLDLRSLDAQHDFGLTCSLPIGRGLLRRALR
jgi:hypothetical protein